MSRLVFKNKLKEYRKMNYFSQEELALRAGTTQNTISAIETYKYCPSSRLAYCLCVVLGCTFEELFYFDKVD